ncbi:acetyl-CoA acetyltransferase [Klebsiella pneumoniae]|uniref:Acetyl-CoA acetyltransferase n=1 Tax=Klebsiella pneumoniae TaxID=573 RepID=A0A378F5A3_KLEPN|nr:acetyl-CoA acetyltransferase [Klebsiella pneumoniae]
MVRADGSVTAGNASGVNDGACALLLASETALSANDLQPLARVVGVATAGVAPRIMGFWPGAGGAQGAGADRPDIRPDGCH